jgi:hypothetical protein
MNFLRSVSDEPILSKFSAEVTISVQPMVPRRPSWKSSGTVGTFTEIIVSHCLVQFLLALIVALRATFSADSQIGSFDPIHDLKVRKKNSS